MSFQEVTGYTLLYMIITYFTFTPVTLASIVAFLFGWLWYSEVLFMKWWLDGMKMTKATMPHRPKGYMMKVMVYTFIVGFAMNGVLAFLLDILQPDTLKLAMSYSVLLALGTISLRNFQEMLHSAPETFWGMEAQKRFFVDTGYYVCMFALSTLVMYYVQTGF